MTNTDQTEQTQDRFATATDEQRIEAAMRQFQQASAKVARVESRLREKLEEQIAEAADLRDLARDNLTALLDEKPLPDEAVLREYMNRPRRGRKPKAETNGEG